MLIAIGNVNMSEMIDGMIAMAKNLNSRHELNSNQPRSWTHGDGWGIAYLKGDKWIISKSTKAIYNDESLQRFRNIKTKAAIMHVRKQSIGETSPENTHPFYENSINIGEVIFCHNGTIKSELSYSPEFIPKGQTDSEKLFYSILTNLKEKKLVDAVRNSLKKIDSASGTNLILATKEMSLIAAKKSNYPRYYQMNLGKKEDLVIISSEIIPELKNLSWCPIEEGSIITLNHHTLQFSVHKEIKVIGQRNPLRSRSYEPTNQSALLESIQV
jgi:predicted glutamine amidotransferase